MAVGFLFLAGCGGDSSLDSAPQQPTREFRTDVQVPGFPHLVDIYVGQDPVRVVVFLHGGLGSKEQFAYNTGVTIADRPPTDASVNWAWLDWRRVVAVFPQGQHLANAPLATTWSNYVMDSGQDDVGFLRALVTEMQSEYGNGLELSLVGYSSGAMMANRVWCESPEIFVTYVALAGPGSEIYLNAASPCTPTTVRPYLGYVGDQDTQLEGSENWTQERWRLRFENAQAAINPNLMGEWTQFVARARTACGQTPDVAQPVQSDAISTTWEACDGRFRVQRAVGLGHSLGAPSDQDPTILSDRALDFIEAQGGL